MKFYILTLFLSCVLSSLVFATWTQLRFSKKASRTAMYFIAIGYLALFCLLSWIPILGWLLKFVLALFGLGSLLLSLSSHRGKKAG